MPPFRKSSAVNSGYAAGQPGFNDGNTAAIKQGSPLKKSVLRDLENLPPSSPELVHSVPETPESQIRLESSFSCRDPGQEGCKSSIEAGLLERLGQLSPICRSPRSKVQNVRRAMTESGQKPRRELEYSSSAKRVISPQESPSVKRSRSAFSPTPTGTRPAKTFDLSNGQPEGIGRGAAVVSHGEEKRGVGIQKDSSFTVIAEQKFPEEKACGSPLTAPRAARSPTRKPSADDPTRDAQRGAQQDQTGPNKSEAGTTSNREPAGGEVEQFVRPHRKDAEAPPVCPVDDLLDESWFSELMDDEMHSTAAKPKKPW